MKQRWESVQEKGASLVVLVVKNPSDNVGDIRDDSSIPGLGRSPGGGHGNPFQYSCLENPMDRGAWWATVHRVIKSWTRLKQLSMQSTHSPAWGFIVLISQMTKLSSTLTGKMRHIQDEKQNCPENNVKK